MIAIKRNISSIRIKNWEIEAPFDNVWIKINTTTTKKIFINCIYINHLSNFDRINSYFKLLHDIINVREPDSHFIILGDFNLSCIEWYFEINKCIALDYEGRLANELLNTLITTSLSQINFIKNSYNIILDLVLTNMENITTQREEGIVDEDQYHPAFIVHVDPKNIKFMKGKKILNIISSKQITIRSIKKSQTSIGILN